MMLGIRSKMGWIGYPSMPVLTDDKQGQPSHRGQVGYGLV
jgi:hypothetical protein